MNTKATLAHVKRDERNHIESIFFDQLPGLYSTRRHPDSDWHADRKVIQSRSSE